MSAPCEILDRAATARGSSEDVLGVVIGPGSISPVQIAESARGHRSLVWIADGAGGKYDPLALRLLAKLGMVVDVSGRSDEEATVLLEPYELDGITCFADEQIRRAAAIGRYLEIGAHSVEVENRLLDKRRQRHALDRGGVPVPSCIEIDTSFGVDYGALDGKVTFPAVVKPSRGAASRDTVMVRDASELCRVLDEATRVRGETVVVEEYMEGPSVPPSDYFADYVSVESVVVAGVISHLAVTGRTPQAPPFRETGLVVPCDFVEPLVEEILSAATDAIEALEIRNGCLHTEVKVTDDGPRIIEVNGRPGGFVPQVLALAAPGVDLIEIAQSVATGTPYGVPGMVSTDGVGFVLVEQPPMWASRIRRVSGLDKLISHPGIASVMLSRHPGDAVDWRRGSHEYAWAVLGRGGDHDEVRALHRFIAESVSTEYE